MSGGSLDYVFGRVEDAAEEILSRAETPLQRAFAKHLFNVSAALHDLEWVYSDDYARGDEIEAIQKVVSQAELLRSELEDAKVTLANLKSIIEDVEK